MRVSSWRGDDTGSPAVEPRLLDSRSVRQPEVTSIDPLLISLIAVLLGAVALAVAIVAWRRGGDVDRRLAAITRGAAGDSLEVILASHVERVFAVARDLEAVASRTAALEDASLRAVSRLGLVRYNPFGDTGGNQSFVVAALDARGDGVILTSLHSRHGTRIYAKGVRGGRPDAALSEEETEALRLARTGE